MAPLLATAVWLSWLPSHKTLSALTQFTNTCSSSESNKLTRGSIPPKGHEQKVWFYNSFGQVRACLNYVIHLALLALCASWCQVVFTQGNFSLFYTVIQKTKFI